MKRNLITYKELDSTNSEAQGLISTGSVSGQFIVAAGFQHHGRGRNTNRWVSEPGSNLLMSWVVFPAFLSVNLQFQLSKAVSLAIIDLLEGFSVHCSIKWPNDIVCDAGKIGGILIENSLQGGEIRHSIVGIGLNINQKDFPQFPRPATSMTIETGEIYDPVEIRDSLISHLIRWYEKLEGGENGTIDTAYLSRLYRMNELSVFIDDNGEFTGVISGVNETGELLVQRERNLHVYGFHEIKMC
jgi:BirA family transcriptional regulator, biotin operon repressor / biotin---[acetyl-CoA-carboxylase] ligase